MSDKLYSHFTESEPPQMDNSLLKFINGPVLSVAEWFTQGLRTPPSYHSAMCAVGFAGGSLAGGTLMSCLTGVDITPITGGLSDVSYKPLKASRAFSNFLTDKLKDPPLKYNPHSLEYKDQWMRVAHFAVPLLIGAATAYMMSNWYFAGKNEKLSKSEYLDEYDLAAGAVQARPWRAFAAASVIPRSLSGLPFVPFFPDYAAAMSATYSLNAGRGVITPGLNQLLSNKTSTHYPQNGSLLLRYLAAYGAFNPSKDLKDGQEIVHDILHHFFDNNETKEQEQKFLSIVMELRDELRKIHKSPVEMQRILESRLTGQGFENLLQEVGLDPKNAKIGNNGLLGGMADFGIALARTVLPNSMCHYFGFDETISELNNERIRKLIDRQSGRRTAPIRILNPGIDPLNLEEGESHLDGAALTQSMTKPLPYQLYQRRVFPNSVSISEESTLPAKEGHAERNSIMSMKDKNKSILSAPAKSHTQKASDPKDTPGGGLGV